MGTEPRPSPRILFHRGTMLPKYRILCYDLMDQHSSLQLPFFNQFLVLVNRKRRRGSFWPGILKRNFQIPLIILGIFFLFFCSEAVFYFSKNAALAFRTFRFVPYFDFETSQLFSIPQPFKLEVFVNSAISLFELARSFFSFFVWIKMFGFVFAQCLLCTTRCAVTYQASELFVPSWNGASTYVLLKKNAHRENSFLVYGLNVILRKIKRGTKNIIYCKKCLLLQDHWLSLRLNSGRSRRIELIEIDQIMCTSCILSCRLSCSFTLFWSFLLF